MSSRLEIPLGARVEGLIECDSPDVDVIIEGKFDGIVDIGGSLRVARGASVAATVRARRVRVVGDVIGNITSGELIEVGAGGRVVGDLRAPDIAIDASATVDGRVDLLPPGPELGPLDRMEIGREQISGWRPRKPRPPLSAAPSAPRKTVDFGIPTRANDDEITTKIPAAPDVD